MSAYRPLQAAVGTLSTVSTGNKSVTGLGFMPKIVKFSWLEVTNNTDAATGQGVMTASAQNCVSWHVSSGAFHTFSSTSNCLADCPFNSDVPANLASYVSMDTDGFTINFSAASGALFGWEAWG